MKTNVKTRSNGIISKAAEGSRAGSGESDVRFRSIYIPPANLPVAALRNVLATWVAARADGAMPKKSDLGLFDFEPDVVAMMALVDFGRKRNAIRYSYFGTGLKEIHGQDYTGGYPADVEPPSVGASAHLGYMRLLGERVPNCEVKEFTDGQGAVGREIVLRLPLLADDDATSKTPGRIAHGVGASYYELADPDQPLAFFFDEVFSRIPY